MKELAKTYDPKAMEDRIYGEWLEKKYFHAEVDRSKKPFTIVMPPPNITGKLHMGHALDNTLQDILIRYKRMQGYNALWIPGTDHASISTEVKVINQLKSEGIDKNELGREGFLKRTWEWREEYGRTIVDQLKKIGSSCDWDRERFTMDEGCSKAVQEVFLRLHKKGYIYKGSRIINWCPVCKTSISDAEVEHEEQAGHFWHINYPIKGSDKFVEIATTRPETLLGDSALAVNPDDERYKDIVGKTVILPLVGREIPVIADAYVDKEFGTGVVKITPAHDPNDFEVGKRHNLPEINILNDDATINENGGKYAGMDRYEARKVMVEELKEQGLLVKVVDHVHNVGTHDRCGTTVEPMIKQQWFVKMEEMAKPAIEAIKNGDLTFVPERFDKTYLHWLENIRDWCISRQLWWGHRIPAYYCDDCGEIVVDREMPKVCPKCGGTHFTQDPDTLDTWFSSALWPFSTLGWPENTEDLDYFYPTDVLVTGYDIIFFWVIRMVFSGYEQTGKCPFHHVLIHGLVRDSLGRKMSKSLGNGIDPLEIIDQYGADALRFTLVTGNAPGNDMRFYMERVEASRNFANKIWNASRFIMMNVTALKENEHEQSEYSFSTEQSATDRRSGACVKEMDLTQLTGADKWILSKVNTLAQDVTANMDKFELGIAVQKLYDFIWEEFCDWYIEMVKPRLYNEEDQTKAAALWTLKTVLTNALKLLHPYMPFITEEIYRNLTGEESIMISAWPEFKEEWSFQKEEAEVELIKEAVRSIRNVRSSMNVPPSKKAHVIVVSEKPQVREVFEGSKAFFGTLSYASQVTVQEDKSGIGEDAVSALIPDAAVYMPFAELVDLEKEIERLKKEEERLTKELARVNGMLSNEKFISKAPQSKIDEEKEKLEKYTQMMNQVKEHLAALVK
ncbi:valine--tRNA ligase [Laedolimicola ammoniilytica]|uniref:Valine--tRNA ligase n=1 Tax=Laedolimicola ammoniilytica TaxID=2981771 RepID=A0ABT2RXG4_9FIRM|nr:valine--tRNA ligase [Laedolimicola ammoniilytica]MCU6696996.1 valine--tRNA ligase [Laedolimicola ammoniilytica]SCI04000.1 Valine--tRNA ligase [uncultured Clostridium sp.]